MWSKIFLLSKRPGFAAKSIVLEHDSQGPINGQATLGSISHLPK